MAIEQLKCQPLNVLCRKQRIKKSNERKERMHIQFYSLKHNFLKKMIIKKIAFMHLCFICLNDPIRKWFDLNCIISENIEEGKKINKMSNFSNGCDYYDKLNQKMCSRSIFCPKIRYTIFQGNSFFLRKKNKWLAKLMKSIFDILENNKRLLTLLFVLFHHKKP